MDYGLQIEPAYGFSYREVLGAVNKARAHGYSSAWVSDHFFSSRNTPDKDCMDCWTLLAGLARDTDEITLGSLVTCVTHRNPALLAKMAATVDRMSGGRLVLGIGAGWNQEEHNAYGYEFPPPGERVERLREGIQVILSLWTEQISNFEGKHYSLKDAVSSPKPLQQPHLPLLIGGSRPRLLRTMARYADRINMGSGQTPESYAANLEKLKLACEEEGSDFDRIFPSHLMTFVIGRDSDELENAISHAAAMAGVSSTQFVENAGTTFIGTTDGAADAIRQYQDAGVREMVTRFPFRDEARSIELMSKEVMQRV